MFELSKFQIFVNKCFKTTMSIAISLSVIQFGNFSSKPRNFQNNQKLRFWRVNILCVSFFGWTSMNRQSKSTKYSTLIKKSSPCALSVVINQLELRICSHFQFWLAHQVKSPAQKKHLCYFPSFGQVFEIFFRKFKFIEFCRLYRIQWYNFRFKNILNGKIIAVFRRETFISYLNTCKLTKFYLSSMIFQKRLIIFQI